MAYDVSEIRSQFECLNRRVGRHPLVYLDNTATSQTPRVVLDAILGSYTEHKANVHRGVHTLSQEATMLLEQARRRVAEWIRADESAEIIFTRGTTEALNLVAGSFGPLVLGPGRDLLITVMEHHANIVPWQLLQPRLGFRIRAVGLRPDGSLDMDDLRAELDRGGIGLVSVTHASNVLGTVNPVAEIAALSHERGIPVCVDGAQAVPHMHVDVKAIGADFYAFSAHKMYGPAGLGALYGRRELLERMPPYQGGGEMIASVSLTRGSTFAELPYKFEAGTPDFVDASGFHAAIDWMERTGVDAIAAHEHELLRRATDALTALPGARVYGTAPGKCAILSFNFDGVHPYDLGMLLDKQGVAIRTGHHCAQPLMHVLGIEGCARASFAAYNTAEEVDAFIAALRKSLAILQR